MSRYHDLSFTQVLILIAGKRACVIGVLHVAVKLTTDPTLIKCAVKLTLFVQFHCKCV